MSLPKPGAVPYIEPMRLTAALLALLVAAAPVSAQNSDVEEGTGLMQEGAKLLLRGLMGEMAPAIGQMERLVELMGDIDQYHMPEMLPNGDIILRRRVPLVPGVPGDPLPESGETDI